MIRPSHTYTTRTDTGLENFDQGRKFFVTAVRVYPRTANGGKNIIGFGATAYGHFVKKDGSLYKRQTSFSAHHLTR